jgi:hypothetical protein
MKLLLGKNNRHLILPLLGRSRTGGKPQIFGAGFERGGGLWDISAKRAKVSTKSVHLHYGHHLSSLLSPESF